MNKKYALKTHDKNVLILLMRLGGRCKASELHKAIPEINWELFVKYLRVLERKSKSIMIPKEGMIDKDSEVIADLEIETMFRG